MRAAHRPSANAVIVEVQPLFRPMSCSELDLVCAFADDCQRRITVIAFYVVFGGVSVTAMDTDRVEDHLGGHLRSVELRHPGPHIHTLTRVVGARGVKDERTSGRAASSFVAMVVSVLPTA